MKENRVLYRGCGCALVTPFTKDNRVNCDAIRTLCDFHLENGTDALIVCGTTGEASTMTAEEQALAVETVAEAVRSCVPVIAGVGGNDTAKVIAACGLAERSGANAVLAVTPYYNKTTQKGLVAHFQAVADASRLPVILYNVPSRTGLNLLPETVALLSEHENIIGNKEASGDIDQIARIIQLCGERMPIYSGNDNTTLPVLALGGVGVISVLANLCPKEMHQICAAFWENPDNARELFLSLLPAMNAIFLEVNPIPVKAAMALMGFDVGDVRLPLVKMQETNLDKMAQVLKGCGILK